jgi:hypothetical protein
VEILKVVAGPPAAGVVVEDLAVLAGLTARMDPRQVLEEQPGTIKEAQQRTIAVLRERVHARLNIGEVPAE